MKLPQVSSQEDIIHLVEELGFLPYFQNPIPGFSLEECIHRRYWFGSEEGAWEWKGPILRRSGCAYGKFFHGKAGFISAQWFPDFANLRRQGYDMDALYDDGYTRKDDLDVWRLVEECGPLLTHELKRLGDFREGGRRGFEGIITRLQMESYLVVSDFEYRRDKNGRPYGWGVARYQTPEERFGAAFTSQVYRQSPEESREKLLEKLFSFLPGQYADKVNALLDRGGVRT